MFLCVDKCHKSCGCIAELMPSVGRCESCGKVAGCADCHAYRRAADAAEDGRGSLGNDDVQAMVDRMREVPASPGARVRFFRDRITGKHEPTPEMERDEARAELAALKRELVRGTLTAASERDAALERVRVLRSTMLELVRLRGGTDHHRDDCPEDGDCPECRFAARVDAALSLTPPPNPWRTMVAELVEVLDGTVLPVIPAIGGLLERAKALLNGGGTQ